MKKYCFKIGFENTSVGYLLADTWEEAVHEAQRIRKEKYPNLGEGKDRSMISDIEEDIVDIKLIGNTVYSAN